MVEAARKATASVFQKRGKGDAGRRNREGRGKVHPHTEIGSRGEKKVRSNAGKGGEDRYRRRKKSAGH